MSLKTDLTLTEYVTLTELWQDGGYLLVGQIINDECWTAARVAEFCAYFNKFLGSDQLRILYKFL